jgi:hypothetical protein
VIQGIKNGHFRAKKKNTCFIHNVTESFNFLKCSLRIWPLPHSHVS